MTWRVVKFDADGMFGFCDDDSQQVFFHAQDFRRITPGGPLPIIGEKVELGSVTSSHGRRPRTDRVTRLQEPLLVEGEISSFDSQRGWGFIRYGEDEQAFFHMSDRAVEWMPVIGSRVQFYVGYNAGRTRACWAQPVRGST